jgi:hypothetical protein
MWPTPKIAFLLMTAHSLLVSGSPVDADALDAALLAKRQCPEIQIFGARETTAPAGYGTAGTVVNLVLGAYPGAQAQAISYPACGGQSSCGGTAYGDSARQGTAAVASAVNSFNQRCPNSKIVLVGYSQVCGYFLSKTWNRGLLTATTGRSDHGQRRLRWPRHRLRHHHHRPAHQRCGPEPDQGRH